MKKPTSAQLSVLDALRVFWTREGIAPSLADLASTLGVTRPTVYKHLQRLEAHGLISRSPGSSRSWRPVEPEPEPPKAARTRARFGLLADADELERWSGTREAESDLPLLVRRLVQAVAPGSFAEFRAGDGVRLPSYDGVVESAVEAPPIPQGRSAWEISTGQDPRRRANDNYRKRTTTPGHVDPASTHFVFVTSRRWPGKARWAAERTSSGPWLSVCVLDADDLESWLDKAPAVRLWISRRLGLLPSGAEDLEAWWERWSNRSRPPVSPDLIVAGRAEPAARTAAIQGGTATCIVGDTAGEALAFIASSILGASDARRAALLSRAVVVHDEATWRQLETSPLPLLLIPERLPISGLSAATRHGHTVLLPAARSEVDPLVAALDLGRVHPEDLRAALEGMGFSREEAKRLVKHSRLSLDALLRSLAPGDSPSWTRGGSLPSEFVVAFLAGAWQQGNGPDEEAIGRLAGKSHEQIAAVLDPWFTGSDAPLKRTDSLCSWRSRAEAARFLLDRLDPRLLERFSHVATAVLSAVTPQVALSVEEQWMAALEGRKTSHSGALRRGLAEGLAILGASERTELEGVAAIAVRTLLHGTSDWRVWASLGDILPLLAEAAPDEFLDAVDAVFRAADATTALLSDESDPLGACNHSGLLWALESLAWDSEYLTRAALALARLARHDPGGRWANRPAESLREIFLPQMPHTQAAADQRIAALRLLGEREPDVAWALVLSLLPDPVSTISMGTHEPAWQRWHLPTPRPVLVRESQAQIDQLVAMLQEWVGSSGSRWAGLVGALHDEILLQRVLPQLEGAVFGVRVDSEADALRRELRRLLHQHREFPDTDWAFSEETLARNEAVYRQLEPSDAVERVAWLFDQNPQLPRSTDRDWRREQEEIEEARRDAVRGLLASEEQAGVQALVARAESPSAVGWATGNVLVSDETVLQFLRPDSAVKDTRTRAFVDTLIRARSHAAGPVWKGDFVRRFGAGWSPAERGRFAAALAFGPETWDFVVAMGEEEHAVYWQSTPASYLREQDEPARAVAALLDAARPHAALWVTSMSTRDRGREARTTLPPDLVTRALVGAAQLLPTDETPPPPTTSWSYDIPRLIEAAEAAGASAQTLAMVEWLWLPVLASPRTRPMHLERALASNPAFFVDVLSAVFRAGGDEVTTAEPSVADRARARAAYRLLRVWSRLPGTCDDGTLNKDELCAWVEEARRLSQAAGRKDIADDQIGQMLAHSPRGSDDTWPHEAVRAAIEDARSRHLERGVSIGVRNGRGVFTKAIGEGGRQEEALAEQYEAWARCLATRWPGTARVLRDVAQAYRRDAEREDLRAELDEDRFI